MRLRRVAGWLVFLSAVSVGQGAARAQTPDADVPSALRSLGERASVVFRGQVTAVRRVGLDAVEVDFRVDEWMKGGGGASYALLEWAGLWTGNPQRWRVGARAVVFLRGTGAAGLASPVDGMDGVVPVVGVREADGEVLLSVDRVRTRVGRAVGTPMVGLGAPMTMAAARAAVLQVGVREPIARPVPVRAAGPIHLRAAAPDVEEGADARR